MSKKFRSVIFPYLFEVLVIRSSQGFSSGALVSTPSNAQENISIDSAILMVVKELRFRAPIEDFNFMTKERKEWYLFSDEDFTSSPTNSRGSGDLLNNQDKDDREVAEHQDDAVEAQEPHSSEHGDYSQPIWAKNII